MKPLAVIAALIPTPLLAGTFDCTFTTECFESEACADSSFTTEVSVENSKITTEFGDLEITAIEQTPDTKVLFAKGDGAAYLLSVTPEAARLTTQISAGPIVVSYLGACEGAF